MMAASLIRRQARVLVNDICLFSRGRVPIRRKQPVIFHNLPVRVISFWGNKKKAETEATKEQNEEELKPREKFIPLTRKTLIRLLIQEDNLLTQEEKDLFEDFCLSLDNAILNKNHGMLQELKAMFDPLNPDKETVVTKQWNRKDRMDTEFWLLQKLSHVMHKANFHELPRSTVLEALADHTSEGVVVSVDPNKYDVLRFWALGKEYPTVDLTRIQRFSNWIRKKPAPKPQEYYKRVVVAVRLKRDDKLMLKAFKEIPVKALERVLPDGQIMMSRLDKGILMTSGGIAMTGILAWVVTLLAHIHIPTTLIFAAIPTAIGIQTWTTYKNRRNRYLADLNRMLYYKNIANNRGLLALLVDRAEDEIFKEAILAYSFLLTNRPPSAVKEGSSSHLPAEQSGLHAASLETNVEEWVQLKTGGRIEFESDQPLKLLQDFGIATESDEQFSVLQMSTAMQLLPQGSKSISDRVDEYDLVEGYDRDITDENENDYKEEEKKRRKFGWF